MGQENSKSTNKLPEQTRLKIRINQERLKLEESMTFDQRIQLHKKILKEFVPKLCKDLEKNLYKEELHEIMEIIGYEGTLKNKKKTCQELIKIGDKLEQYWIDLDPDQPWVKFKTTEQEWKQMIKDQKRGEFKKYRNKFSLLNFFLIFILISGIPSVQADLSKFTDTCALTTTGTDNQESYQCVVVNDTNPKTNRYLVYDSESSKSIIMPDEYEIETIVNEWAYRKFDYLKAQAQPVAIVTVGGPGTGKGSLQASLYKDLGIDEKLFALLDPDEIMKMLKGYETMIEFFKTSEGKTISLIDAQDKFYKIAAKMADEVQRILISKRINIVVDRYDNTEKSIARLRDQGYKIILAKPLGPEFYVVRGRVLSRAELIGRFVPEYVAIEIENEVDKNFDKWKHLVDETYVYDTTQRPAKQVEKYVHLCKDCDKNRENWKIRELKAYKKWEQPIPDYLK